MAANKRTRDQREQARARCADLYAKGWTQAAIAKEMGVAQSQVNYDLKILQNRWRESAMRSWDELRSEQLAKIDLAEREYWQGYERSLKARTKERVGQTTGSQNATTTASVTTESRDGAIGWLQGVERCIGMRIRLLGLAELEHQAASALAKAYSGFDMSAI